MLAENISRVDDAPEMEETHHLGGDALASAVVRESMVTLGKNRVWNRPLLQNSFVVAEEVGRSLDWDS